MDIKKVYEKLCYYDKRNPNSYLEDMTDEEIEEAKVDCYCDNCFYGRTELALEIIKLKESI